MTGNKSKFLVPRTNVRYVFFAIYKIFSPSKYNRLDNASGVPAKEDLFKEINELKKQNQEMERSLRYLIQKNRERRSRPFKPVQISLIISLVTGLLGLFIAIIALLN